MSVPNPGFARTPEEARKLGCGPAFPHEQTKIFSRWGERSVSPTHFPTPPSSSAKAGDPGLTGATVPESCRQFLCRSISTAIAHTVAAAAPGGGAGKVWVNTPSHVYHGEGSKYYGKTKAGEYMTEADAKAKGNHPDHDKACSK